jgi:hypothetical protein
MPYGFTRSATRYARALDREDRDDMRRRSLLSRLPLGLSRRARTATAVTARRASSRHELSEDALSELLRARRARTLAHPDNPGLIASWPGVREDSMAAARAELLGRGHPVFRISIATANPGRTRAGWAVGATTEEPPCQA